MGQTHNLQPELDIVKNWTVNIFQRTTSGSRSAIYAFQPEPCRHRIKAEEFDRVGASQRAGTETYLFQFRRCSCQHDLVTSQGSIGRFKSDVRVNVVLTQFSQRLAEDLDRHRVRNHDHFKACHTASCLDVFRVHEQVVAVQKPLRSLNLNLKFAVVMKW